MKEIKNGVQMPILSVSTREGVSKQSGKPYKMYNIYLQLDDGSIGSLAAFDGDIVLSGRIPVAGDVAHVGLALGQFQKIEARLLAIYSASN